MTPSFHPDGGDVVVDLWVEGDDGPKPAIALRGAFSFQPFGLAPEGRVRYPNGDVLGCAGGST